MLLNIISDRLFLVVLARRRLLASRSCLPIDIQAQAQLNRTMTISLRALTAKTPALAATLTLAQLATVRALEAIFIR